MAGSGAPRIEQFQTSVEISDNGQDCSFLLLTTHYSLSIICHPPGMLNFSVPGLSFNPFLSGGLARHLPEPIKRYNDRVLADHACYAMTGMRAKLLESLELRQELGAGPLIVLDRNDDFRRSVFLLTRFRDYE